MLNKVWKTYKFMLSIYYNKDKPRWLSGKAQAWSSLGQNR